MNKFGHRVVCGVYVPEGEYIHKCEASKPETVEEAAEKYADRIYNVGPGEMVRRDKSMDHQYVRSSYLAGATHTLPKIKELEGKLEIALRALDSISYSEQGTVQQITAQMAIKKIREVK